MEDKKKNDRMILIIVAAAAVVLAVLAAVYVHLADKNANEHCHAVIYIAGERHGDTDEAFEGQQECRSGGYITVGDIELKVTDINRHGRLTFKVTRGTLSSPNGEPVESDSIDKGEKKRYDGGSTSFSITVRRIEKD